MRMLRILSFCLLLALCKTVTAQDTLPKISVKSIAGRNIISWKNLYPQPLKVINIQRSNDSLKTFTTIGSVINPVNVDNGFTDNKPATSKTFYRIFIVFYDNNYLFSHAFKPVPDTTKSIVQKENIAAPVVTVPLLPPVFVPSKYIFTGKDNNVIINIPASSGKKISVKFYDENNHYLFQIKDIKEPYLILEKVNFRHSGWFHFVLFEGDDILEKHKFFIPKETYKKQGPG